MTSLQSLLKELKETYVSLHRAKEDCFWKAKMGIANDPELAQHQLGQAELLLNRFLQNPQQLVRLRTHEGSAQSSKENNILNGWIDMFSAHVIDDPVAQKLSEEIVSLEKDLELKRSKMALGYNDPYTGTFTYASSIKLALMLRTHDDESYRKSALQGLHSIEEFVLENGFLEIVKKRNQLGRMLGYEDYYAWRVMIVEKMSKKDIFSLLDELEKTTKQTASQSLSTFQKKHGSEALSPWNFQYLRSGQLTKKLDPYFSFEKAISRWGRSFSGLNITFRGATLTLDLLDRAGKYENGFMHAPGIAFFDEGQWTPAHINFTANAIPSQSGGGLRALQTLFHEGGHAAHFSNILSDAPCFAHEFAPTSVAYAETQSMFLDSFLRDADWRIKYATNQDGQPFPIDLIQENIQEHQPFRGWDIRSLLTVPFVERALYEQTDEQLHTDSVLPMVRKIENTLLGLSSSTRPTLSVPHLLSSESSAYYHGYLLAEMAVYQTRDFFLKRDGRLTDNPKIGPSLARAYWAPGNQRTFQDTVKQLVGKDLSPQALATDCNLSVEESWIRAKQQVDQVNQSPPFEGPVDLQATIKIVHGNKTIASTENASFEDMSTDFEHWMKEFEYES